jgi:acyl-CoA synthetase (AMP-forming)/AMP-acid ligase II
VEVRIAPDGEVLTRGPHVMKGYWNDAAATAEAIRDGWFYTGDAGTIDAEGFIYIKDRIKDVIVTGSENVYPAEVEASMDEHPDIVELAVIGVPDARWGEAVKAIVVLRDGASLTEATLLDWMRDRIAGYKRPRSVEFIAALPRNASGKVLKRQLREPYWKGHARRVN